MIVINEQVYDACNPVHHHAASHQESCTAKKINALFLLNPESKRLVLKHLFTKQFYKIYLFFSPLTINTPCAFFLPFKISVSPSPPLICSLTH